MGAIQNSINSVIQSAGYLKKIKDIKNDNKYISNPNILKWKQAETYRAIKNALIKERMNKLKAQQSLTSQAEQKAKQKSDFKDLQLSIGGQKIDYNMLGENVKKQIDKEINDDK